MMTDRGGLETYQIAKQNNFMNKQNIETLLDALDILTTEIQRELNLLKENVRDIREELQDKKEEF